mmetsp:Transcript_65824/g.122791  ORF Transcript_65824/g.122791 Transcript_65824/m.122791 type:complete len:1154 (-) Transcript_65824:161-3622(-)
MLAELQIDSEAPMTSAASEPASSPRPSNAGGGTVTRKRQGSCTSYASTAEVMPHQEINHLGGVLDNYPVRGRGSIGTLGSAHGRQGGRNSMDSSVSRPRSIRMGSEADDIDRSSGGRSDADRERNLPAASWPVMGFASRLSRSTSSNVAPPKGRRHSKTVRTAGSAVSEGHRSALSKPGSRRASMARGSISPSSSHRTLGDDGDSSPTQSRTSSSAFSRKPSVSFSLSSFRQDMVKSKPPKMMRRHSRAYRAADEAAEAANISVDTIGHVLRAETKKMKSKATSKTYVNDRRTVLVERELLHVHKQAHHAKGSKGRRQESVLGRTLFNTYGNKDSHSGMIPSSASDSTMELGASYLGKVTPMKWAMTVLIGLIIALQAGAIIMGAMHLTHWKLDLIWHYGGGDSMEGRAVAFAFLIAYGLVGAFVAAMLVTYIAPHAGGSGIPEIKACLNGTPQPLAFTFKTWASRSIGLLLVTSGGLFAGTEGPFAHLGAIVASAVAEGPTINGKPLWPAVLTGYRNRCDFISQGAAMGVAAAFGAPVGGILFSLEEASTFWSKSVTWQAFLGALVAAVVAKLAKSGFTELPKAGFIEFPDHDAAFKLWEMGIFLAIGLSSGFVGALFCQLVKRMLIFRRRLFRLGSPTLWSRRARVAEVLLVVTVSLGVCFWIPALIGCTDIDDHHHADSGHHRRLGGGGSSGPPDLRGGICPDDQYSSIAYLLLEPKEVAIKALFTETMEYHAVMEIPHLLITWFIIFTCTILTFGTAIPVGLFIPNILAGACLGRAVGQGMLDAGYAIHPGVYALMGAAGALAGFSRMTMSLAVIFLEITNNMYLLLPLMLVIMSSKTVADRFNPSVYDIVIELNPEVQILEDNLSEDMLIVLEGLTAHDACTAEVAVLREIETVRQVVATLMQTPYGTYPIIDTAGRLVGTVSRMQLTAILAHQEKIKGEPDDVIYLLDMADMSPEMSLWNTPLSRSFHHFRSLGLQHLCVVGESMVLLGILTRTDFARLCSHGHEGVEEVRRLYHRKHAAIVAGAASIGAASYIPDEGSDGHSEPNSGSDAGRSKDHVLIMSSALKHPVLAPPDAHDHDAHHNGTRPNPATTAAALAVARASASKQSTTIGSPPSCVSPSKQTTPTAGACDLTVETSLGSDSACFEV